MCVCVRVLGHASSKGSNQPSENKTKYNHVTNNNPILWPTSQPANPNFCRPTAFASSTPQVSWQDFGHSECKELLL